jgi:hypothetical protein
MIKSQKFLLTGNPFLLVVSKNDDISFPGIIYLISKVSPITPVNNLKKLIE